MGDVHGEFELLLDILKKWDEERQQLIFLGDLIDRGENSKACLELVWQLVREKEAICLTGNHERMFLAWLRDPWNAMIITGGMVAIRPLILFLGVPWIHLWMA